MKLKIPTELTISDEVSGKLYPYGVGIDCHRDMVWACVLQPIYDSGKQKRVVRALAGWRPTVINPMLVGSAKRKTDRWDAQTLAHHSIMGKRIPASIDAALAVLTDDELDHIAIFIAERREAGIRRLWAKRKRRPSWKNRTRQRRFA